jgi:hypothetical protein
MKRCRNKNRPRKVSSILVLLLGIVAILAGMKLPAIAAEATADSGFALLLQPSPADGGNIMPGDGVHRVQIGGSIPLTAVPKRGYRFLYWLGDVGQTDRVRTSVRMDSPKLVVAVFEREQFENLLPTGIVSGSSTGGLIRSPGFTSASGGDITPYNPPENPPNNPPDNPPVVPEPASFLLLGLGLFAVSRMRK